MKEIAKQLEADHQEMKHMVWTLQNRRLWTLLTRSATYRCDGDQWLTVLAKGINRSQEQKGDGSFLGCEEQEVHDIVDRDEPTPLDRFTVLSYVVSTPERAPGPSCIPSKSELGAFWGATSWEGEEVEALAKEDAT